jgi:hypothetical protein
MKNIISRAESLRILRNQLRKTALEKRAVELKSASLERRDVILAEIERDVEKEVQEYKWTSAFGNVIQ